LKRAVVFLVCVALATPLALFSQDAEAPHERLTVEKIFAHGPLIGEVPDDISWSADDRHVSYMDGGELIDLDPGTGKAHVLVSRAKIASLDGTKVSERDRDHRARYGQADYQWAPDSKHLLFDSSGRLWVYDTSNGTGVEIGFTGEAAGDDPKFSPNGEYVSFVRNHGLALLRIKDSGTSPVVVAPSPNEATYNGEVDWVYEEELDVRSNYFWSPDSKAIAFLQMNEADVPLYPITDWIPTHPSVYLERYPQPGDPNPSVRVGVISASGGRVVWIHLPFQEGNDYIPRFGWVDRKTLWIETLTRDHKHRILYFAEASSGQAHQVLEIDDAKFLDENYDVYLANGTIILTNWSDGHNQIYLYRFDQNHPSETSAQLDKQLTTGDSDVAAISNVDHEGKMVYYASNEGNVLDKQVWQVSFDGERKQLSSGSGEHEANFAHHGDGFVDRFSTRMQPPVFELRRGSERTSLFWSTHALEPYRLRTPEQLEVKASDGQILYATLLLPAGDKATASVPLIVNPYGGPGPQEVANRWSDALLFDELLAEHGFAVLHADNRGTGMRGREFAQAAYHNFGPVQLADQLTVIDAGLAKYPELDPKRLGWWGWSWGGTFTLYAMTHSDRFRAGVAVAPVTDWRDYDSIYTERYLGQPTEDPDGYKDFSVVNSAAHLKGHLLMVHGTGDDNVHMENTIQFIQRLIEADLPYDLQLYPRKTHSIAGEDVRTHLYNRILAYFEQYLSPPVE